MTIFQMFICLEFPYFSAVYEISPKLIEIYFKHMQVARHWFVVQKESTKFIS